MGRNTKNATGWVAVVLAGRPACRDSESTICVEGISEALAAEVTPLGIHVTIVEPGLRGRSLTTPRSQRPKGCKRNLRPGVK